MPIDVTMPDGTVIQGVPDNITQSELTSRYAKMQQTSAPAAPSFGPMADTVASDPIARDMPLPIMNRRNPVTTRNAVDMNSVLNSGQGATAEQQGDYLKGTALTAVTGIPGMIGDTEALGRLLLSPLGVSRNPDDQFTWSTNQIADGVAGKPQNEFDAGGRRLGSLLSPMVLSALMKAPGGIRSLMGDAPDLSPTERAAAAARESGYAIPPTMASENPSMTSTALSAIGGKVKTQQLASTKNAATGTAALAEDLGLPKDTTFTPDVLEGVRANAGKAYEAVRGAPVQVIPDRQYAQDVAALDTRGAAARAEVPGLVENPQLDKLTENLSNIQQLSPDAAVDTIRSLRFKAQKNLGGVGASPETIELGHAQSKAANALETLLERNLQAATTARGPIGAQGGDMSALVDQLQKARTTIAKTYSIQDAANPVTGVIDPQVLAAMTRRGAPLSGALADLGNAAVAFPKAFQNPTKFGGNEPLSVLDAAFALGNKAGAAVLGRPLARHLILSDLYQKMAIPQAASAAASGAPAASSLLNSPVIRAMMLQRLLAAPATAAVSQPAQ